MDGPAAVSSHVSCGQRLWSGGWTVSDRAKKRLLQSNVCSVDILTLRYCFIRDVLLWVGGCMHNKLSPTSLVAKSSTCACGVCMEWDAITMTTGLSFSVMNDESPPQKYMTNVIPLAGSHLSSPLLWKRGVKGEDINK